MDHNQTPFDNISSSARELGDFKKKAGSEISDLRKRLKSEAQKSEKLISKLKDVSDKLSFITEIMNKVNVVIFINRITDLKKGTFELKWASNYYEEMLGFTQEEVMAMGTEKHQKENWHEGDYKELGNYHGWKLEDGQANGLYRRKHKDGSIRWIYVTARNFKHDEEGNTTEILGVAIDLTNRIQTEEQLAIMLRENLQLRNKLIVNYLTCREKQILISIGDGMTNKQIAESLDISVHTVDSHRKNLLSKLHLNNTAELIKLAAKSGLV